MKPSLTENMDTFRKLSLLETPISFLDSPGEEVRGVGTERRETLLTNQKNNFTATKARTPASKVNDVPISVITKKTRLHGQS
jgi:hypothetical protein